jgi:DNA-directed RNA polymerase specialized sigma24 family protein
MEALPEDLRIIVNMKYKRGLSCAQIAAKLNRPLNTVTKLLSRAYEKLESDMRSYFSRKAL